MDPRERIALWVALVVLLVFVLVRSTSSFVGSQMSFVDLAEFDTLPADLKKMYYDTMVNGVAKEAGQKVTSMWSALTPAQKEEAKAQAAKQAKMVVEQIKSGKGGVMVLPPPMKQESAMKPMQEPVKVQGKIAEPVQNWMPIDSQKNMQQMGGVAFAPQQGKIEDVFKPQQGMVQMQGKIAETKPMPLQDFGMKMGLAPGQMQGKIAETKPMPLQDFGMKMGLAPGQMQGKIAETKPMPLQDFGMKMGLAPGQMQGKIGAVAYY